MSATEKVFWKDAYLTRLRTRVSAVEADRVRLASTLFFAFSGGQESDAGTIGGHCEPILAEAAARAAAAHPIVTAFSDEQNQRRSWEADGFARMGCGGTHPRTTAEIGPAALKRKNQGQGIERIEITLAAAAAPG